MQLALIDSDRPVMHRTSAEAPARVSTSALDRAAPLARELPEASRVTPMRGGLRVLDLQLNRRVSGAQQALAFLDQAATQLHELRVALGSHLSKRESARSVDGVHGGVDSATAALEGKLRRFGELWRERASATAGTLDARLNFEPSGRAQQRFTVRGLEMASLRVGNPETLTLAVGSNGQREATAVTIVPGLPDAAIARRFDQALAPFGIRAARDDRGELVFSVREPAWPVVRDSLAIKGEGIRFPTGQFSRVRTVAEESVIRPQEWSAKDVAALRITQQQVLDAEERVHRARNAVSRSLAEVSEQLGARVTEDDARWSAEFVRTFEATVGRGDYPALSAILPALSGISRQRVTALLAGSLA